MKVADYLVKYLSACGVRQIFGYPGSPLVPILAALRRQSDVEWILMRHENAAALAASAQAKLTGQLAVCLATSGPGALQTVCGVADAHFDRAPVLALTGVVSRKQQAHWGFQDVDQTSLYTTILEQSFSCVSSEQLVSVLRKLTGHALHYQQAVHLSLPIDVLEEDIDVDDKLFSLGHFAMPSFSAGISMQDDIDRAVNIISQSRPIIVVGRRAKGAGLAIEALSEKIDAPIVATLDGKGIVNELHDNYLGVLGIFGHPGIKATRKIVQESSCVISFGVDHLRPFLSDGRHVQKRKVIQSTTLATTASLEYQSDAILIGDQTQIARLITENIRKIDHKDMAHKLAYKRNSIIEAALKEIKTHDQEKTTNPFYFISELNNYLSPQTTIIVDTGSHTLWASLFLKIKDRESIIVSHSLGVMGFSLPALIAAQVTNPNKRAMAICGDGGLGMTGMELATAVQYKLPIILIVINNGVLQNVAAQQDKPFGVDLHNPDLVQFAQSFGAEAAHVDEKTDIKKLLDRVFTNKDKPFVIDVRCNPALIAPFNKWEQEID